MTATAFRDGPEPCVRGLDRPFTIHIVGNAGCGKTALIEALAGRLPDLRMAAVVAAAASSERDVRRLRRLIGQVATIDAAVLDRPHLEDAERLIDLAGTDLLFVESCDAGGGEVADVGQHFRVGVMSVSGGAEMPAKHPLLVNASDVLVLNKVDLLGHSPFDEVTFQQNVAALKALPIFAVSTVSGEGVDALADLLRRQFERHQPRPSSAALELPEWFVG